RSQYNNWRSRVWKPVMEALASGEPPQPRLAAARPYDCRGSFVSLQLRAGASPLAVASWAGHSPQVMFADYANVIEELVGEPTLSAEDQISRARRIVEVTEAIRLNQLMGELIECPTVSASTGPSAARLLYEPKAGS